MRIKIKISYANEASASQSKNFNTYEIYFDQLHTITCANSYSANIWKHGERLTKNFEFATALVLDSDGTWPIAEAKKEFTSTENVLIVTSKSHQSDFKIKELGVTGKAIEKKDYFHIIIALPEPITDVNIYKTVMKNLTEKYPVDPACKDAARFFFPAKNQIHWYS